MKVSPSNQTLILAGERADGKPGLASTRDQSGGATLQHVTIVAARPDATLVYFRADYASPNEGPRVETRPQRPVTPGDVRDTYGNPQTSGGLRSPGNLPPVEQYARTQRILADKAETSIDVHA